jgi:hypothetical protein
MSENFKEKFGLDYLIRPAASVPTLAPSAPGSAAAQPRGLEDAVNTYGTMVISALSNEPNQTMKLFEIARNLSVRIDTLLPIVSYLFQRGYVSRQEDPSGNDNLQLTDTGRSAAKDLTVRL